MQKNFFLKNMVDHLQASAEIGKFVEIILSIWAYESKLVNHKNTEWKDSANQLYQVAFWNIHQPQHSTFFSLRGLTKSVQKSKLSQVACFLVHPTMLMLQILPWGHLSKISIDRKRKLKHGRRVKACYLSNLGQPLIKFGDWGHWTAPSSCSRDVLAENVICLFDPFFYLKNKKK